MTNQAVNNLLENIPAKLPVEIMKTLVRSQSVRIEQIISTGQVSPPDFWYDQVEHEWVLLLTGEAEILMRSETVPIALKPGDSLLIPAHQAHRVAWTSPVETTVWLAIFYTD